MQNEAETSAATRPACLTAAFLLLATLIACGDDSTTTILSGDVRALTYNVAGLPEGLSSSNPAVNTPLISPLLNAYDLVLLQESWQTPDPNPLAPLRVYHELLVAGANHPFKSQPLENPLGGNPDRPSALVSDGLNRFSNLPFAEVMRQRWQGCDDSSADCLSLKGFSVARTELAPGVCVDVYNLHGEAGNTPNDRDLKDQNTRDLLAVVREFSVDRAIIMGGDFNMRLRRERDAANLNLLVSDGGLQDACIAQGVTDDEVIDKFFFRSSQSLTITPTTCRFEIETFVDPQGEPLSDHDPLAVRFAWTATPDPGESCL